MKICSHCKKEKEYNEFSKDKSKKDGYRYLCKICVSILSKEQRKIYYKTNKEKYKDYYIKNKHEFLKKYRKNSRKLRLPKKYNITIDEYELLYNNQNGCCKICGLKLEILCIDHNHTTGRVRGLLCGKCNSGIGFFNDNPDLLKNAAKYLKERKE
jgi:hypothetical protein